MQGKHQYFDKLDSLRAIAALVVVIAHIKTITREFKIPNIFDLYNIITPNAHTAVVLFFVLSGFLITYLLKKEIDAKESIDFRKFYMRRILRIWPVYYIVLISSILIFNINFEPLTYFLCFAIFPNIASILNIEWSVSPQLWSIGVEEQFYIFWPLLLSFIHNKRTLILLIIFFFVYTIIPYIIGFINVRTINNTELGRIVYTFFFQAKFNSMCLGGILGWVVASKSKITHLLTTKFIAYSSSIVGFSLWLFDIHFDFFDDEIYSLFFGLIILNFTVGSHIWSGFNAKWLSFLGKISYGMYMYHWIIILVIIKSFPTKHFQSIVSYNIFLIFTTLILTILISWVSKRTIEQYFLNLKNKFN